VAPLEEEEEEEEEEDVSAVAGALEASVATLVVAPVASVTTLPVEKSYPGMLIVSTVPTDNVGKCKSLTQASWGASPEAG
jgi:hypothetical protein